MTDTRTTGTTDPAIETVAAAIGRLGEATAAAIAAEAGIPYSTTNKKLRALQAAGRAEAFKADDTRTKWRPTSTSHTTVTQPEQPNTKAVAEPVASGDVEPSTTDLTVDGDYTNPAAQADSDKVDDTGPPDRARDHAEAASSQDQLAPVEPTAGIDNLPSGTQSEPGCDAPDQPLDPGPPQQAGGRDNGDTGDPDPTDTSSANAPTAGEAHQEAQPPAPGTETNRPTGDTAQPEPSQTAQAKGRRGKGRLRDAVLKILQDHPDTQYKVGELCKLIDQADAAKASAGAVANALDKLVGDGSVNRTVEKPATFQAA